MIKGKKGGRGVVIVNIVYSTVKNELVEIYLCYLSLELDSILYVCRIQQNKLLAYYLTQ
jgi:hypothetical protein